MLQWDGAELIPTERQWGKCLLSHRQRVRAQGHQQVLIFLTRGLPVGTWSTGLHSSSSVLIPALCWAVSQDNVAGIKVLSPTWFLFRDLCSVFLEDKFLCLVLCCTWSVLLLIAAGCGGKLCVINLALWLVGQVQSEQYFCVIFYLFSWEGVITALRADFSCTLHLPSTVPAEIRISGGLIRLLSPCEGLPQVPNNIFSPLTTLLPCSSASQLQPWFTQGPVTMLGLQRGPSIHLPNSNPNLCISLPFPDMLRSLTFQSILNVLPFL